MHRDRPRARAPLAPLALLAALALAAPGGVLAQQPPTVPPQPATPVRATEAVPTDPSGAAPRGLRDRAELEAFIDGLMTAQLRDKHVAGATVSVVKDGQLFFSKGYGWSDLEKRQPVDPARTLFRIGSTSKLFTWTAVMQLVEQGKLDLDTDVNTYLDFKIPATYPQPITLRHIMTHTPGFEEDGRDLIGDELADTIPLGRFLATHMPERVRPPGTYSSYSNYATAMAGYIVQRVSGLGWPEYVERHILQPLGMQYTSAKQPLEPRLAPHMSKGYQWANGKHEPKYFEVILGGAPAGSMSASADDMAKFMIAHLNHGAAPNGQRILAESTAALMHQRAFSHDPRIPGFALGFYEQSSHGLRMIGHGGDVNWFHTDMALIPEENVGLFVSYNTNTGGELSFGPFRTAFLDHYYPTRPAPVTITEEAKREAQRIAGEYQFNRMSYSTFQKAMGLTGAVNVGVAEDGALLVASPLGVGRWVPVGDMLYREEMGTELMAFKGDESGTVTHGFMGMAPMMALERVPWYMSPKLHWVLLGIGTFVFVWTVLAAIGRLVRRRTGETRPGDALPGRALLVGVALANLAFLVALAVFASSDDLLSALNGPLTGLKVALALPVIALLLAIGAAVFSVRHWRQDIGPRFVRLRYSAIVAIALLFAWSLSRWNLLFWQF